MSERKIEDPQSPIDPQVFRRLLTTMDYDHADGAILAPLAVDVNVGDAPQESTVRVYRCRRRTEHDPTRMPGFYLFIASCYRHDAVAGLSGTVVGGAADVTPIWRVADETEWTAFGKGWFDDKVSVSGQSIQWRPPGTFERAFTLADEWDEKIIVCQTSEQWCGLFWSTGA